MTTVPRPASMLASRLNIVQEIVVIYEHYYEVQRLCDILWYLQS